MEKQSFLREVTYREEKFKVKIEVYIDPETKEEYTTTESDQKWWEDLRRQYLERHPEVLKDFIISFPEDKIKITFPEEIWEATWIDFISSKVIIKTGKTKEEALSNLWVSLEI